MAADSSHAINLSRQDQEENMVRESLLTSCKVVPSPPENGPLSPGPAFHTAFMQCRSCCNCDPQCSYYGKGHFDAKGNYVGF